MRSIVLCLVQMPGNPASWARRQAFGIDLTKPGVEDNHFHCAGYYSCTETGFGEIVLPGAHVWAVLAFEYDKGIRSDRRAPAYEPILITHIEATADGLSIHIFGVALLNWPRLRLYRGEHRAPQCMMKDASQFVYSNWEVSAAADTQEGFVGIYMAPPQSPPRLSGSCEDTIGCIGYVEVRASPPRSSLKPHRRRWRASVSRQPFSNHSRARLHSPRRVYCLGTGLKTWRRGAARDRHLHPVRPSSTPSPFRFQRRPRESWRRSRAGREPWRAVHAVAGGKPPARGCGAVSAQCRLHMLRPRLRRHLGLRARGWQKVCASKLNARRPHYCVADCATALAAAALAAASSALARAAPQPRPTRAVMRDAVAGTLDIQTGMYTGCSA